MLKFSVESSALKNAMTRASLAINPRSPSAMLKNLLVEADHTSNTIFVTGASGDIRIKVGVQAESISTSGTILVPPLLASALPDVGIAKLRPNRKRIRVSAGGRVVDFNTQPADTFWSIPDDIEYADADYQFAEMAEGLKRVAQVAMSGQSSAGHVLSNVRLRLSQEEDQDRGVGTTSCLGCNPAAFALIDDSDGELDRGNYYETLIPEAAARKFAKIKASDLDTTKAYVCESSLSLMITPGTQDAAIASIEVFMPLPEANYPDLSPILGAPRPNTFTVDRKQLAHETSTANMMAENDTPSLKVTGDGTTLSILLVGATRRFAADVPMDGDPFSFTVRADHISEALSGLSMENVSISCADSVNIPVKMTDATGVYGITQVVGASFDSEEDEEEEAEGELQYEDEEAEGELQYEDEEHEEELEYA